MNRGRRTDYRPIDCGRYSELELAILHRRRLHLLWCEGNVLHRQRVLPLDLETREGEEFLHFLDQAGRRRRIRLDRIRRFQ